MTMDSNFDDAHVHNAFLKSVKSFANIMYGTAHVSYGSLLGFIQNIFL